MPRFGLSPFLAGIFSLSLRPRLGIISAVLSASPLCSSHSFFFSLILILSTLFWKYLLMWLFFPVTCKLLKSRCYVFPLYCIPTSKLSAYFKVIHIYENSYGRDSVSLYCTELIWAEAKPVLSNFKAPNISHYTSLPPIPTIRVLLHFGPNKQWTYFCSHGIW